MNDNLFSPWSCDPVEFEKAFEAAQAKADEVIKKIKTGYDLEKGKSEIWYGFFPAIDKIWRVWTRMWERLHDARYSAMMRADDVVKK